VSASCSKCSLTDATTTTTYRGLALDRQKDGQKQSDAAAMHHRDLIALKITLLTVTEAVRKA
jgi:hypothetical protein